MANPLTTRQNRPRTTATLQAIPNGVAGVRHTLQFMRGIVRESKSHIALREIAMSLVSDLAPKDWHGEIGRLFAFVRDDIRYCRDIDGIETLSTPEKTLEYGQGDCDDKAILLATLLATIGHPSRFVAMGVNNGPISHVLVEVRIGNRWVSLETTECQPMGWQPPNITSTIIMDN